MTGKRAWLSLLGGLTAGMVAAGAMVRRRNRAELHDRVALVTGGSRGLGLEIARELVRQGARVVLCARDEDQVVEAERSLRDLGGAALGIVCDVTDPEDVATLVERAVAWQGRLDVVVANAGTLTVGPFENQGVEDVQHALDVMFWGAYHPVVAALPHLRDSDAPRVAVVTSIGGKLPAPHLLPYAIAKHAAVGFSEGLRVELAGDGIPVTTVVPGLMRTGSHLHALTKGQHDAEFAWFGLGATLPLTAIPAERAAQRIVAATSRGDAEVILSWQAHLATRAHGIAPALGTRVAGIVARLLPGPTESLEGDEHVRGVRTDPGQGVIGALGTPAARRHGQRTE